MSTRVRFFLFIESILAIYLAYQVISNPATLVFSILGVLALLWASSMKNKAFFRTAVATEMKVLPTGEENQDARQISAEESPLA